MRHVEEHSAATLLPAPLADSRLHASCDPHFPRRRLHPGTSVNLPSRACRECCCLSFPRRVLPSFAFLFTAPAPQCVLTAALHLHTQPSGHRHRALPLLPCAASPVSRHALASPWPHCSLPFRTLVSLPQAMMTSGTTSGMMTSGITSGATRTMTTRRSRRWVREGGWTS